MKLLIVYQNTYQNTYNRYSVLATTLAKLLTDMNVGITVTLVKYRPYKTDYPLVDHSLTVSHKGFKMSQGEAPKQFLSVINSVTSNCVASLCSSVKQFCGEDTLFQITDSLNISNISNKHFIGYSVDHNLFKPEQDNDVIRVATDNINYTYSQDTFTVQMYDSTNLTVDLINKLHIYILTQRYPDVSTLFELGTSNVMIVAHKDCVIKQSIVDLLKITRFSEQVDFDTLFKNLYKHNVRQKIIDCKLTLKDTANRLAHHFLDIDNRDNRIKTRKIIDVFTNPVNTVKSVDNESFEQYVCNKYKPVTLDLDRFKETLINIKETPVKEQLETLKKPMILLQSQILKKK